MEALDENCDLIAWIDDDWLDWTHPDVATKDTFFDDIPCSDDYWESVKQF